MAVWFSDNFARTDSATALETGFLPGPGGNFANEELGTSRTHTGFSHARTRTTYARVLLPTTYATTEVIRMFSLRSGDRILDMNYSTLTLDDTTSITLDIGLYKAGAAHDGAVIDLDLFTNVDDVSTPDDIRVDALLQATTLAQIDRGKTLWEMADIGAGTYTTDPGELWDICAAFNLGSTLVAGTLMMECTYVAGD